MHPKNAEDKDKGDAEASEQHEVEADNEDNHGNNEHGEISANDGEDQSNGVASGSTKNGDYARIDYGTTPPDHGFGWLQPTHSCGIDPTILRVNKKIHDEGISLLYKNVSCRFFLDRDLRCWSIQRYLMQEYYRSYVLDKDNPSYRMDRIILCTRHYNSRSNKQNGLNLHCLRWVPDIHVDISWGDLLEGPNCRDN